MRVIWAPWRIEYILSKKPEECIFCEYPKLKDDRKHLILYRGTHAYVIMNKYPYNNGHLMAVPYFHSSSFEGLAPDVLGELMELTRLSVHCLEKTMRPEGFNMGINFGKVAGAGIEEHMHIHIVPRWAGDASFMTVLGEVRVIPEHMLATYDKLYPVFNSASKKG